MGGKDSIKKLKQLSGGSRGEWVEDGAEKQLKIR